jgi:uncharacterized protein YjbI with pentapeptide repeats
MKMSELTPEQILDLIDKSDTKGLDLSGKDLENIDLSHNKAAELGQKYGENLPKGIRRYENDIFTFNLTIFDGEKIRPVNLQDAKLCGANLEGVDGFEKANFQKADLTHANLQGLWLSDANMQGAWCINTNLQNARLCHANLRNARLIFTNLQKADLEGVDLQGAQLLGTTLEGAYLFEANLRGAKFFTKLLKNNETRQIFIEELDRPIKNDTDVWIKKWAEIMLFADYVGVNLKGANLKCARLEGIDLGRANLERAFFYGAYLKGTIFGANQIKPEIGEEKDGSWYEAKESYLSLKNHFTSQGRYDDARWAYVKERKMERKCFFPSTEGEEEIKNKFKSLPEGSLKKIFGCAYNWWLNFKLFLWPKDIEIQRFYWLRNMVWEFLCNYGESFFRPILWGLFIMLILSPPLLYGFGGIVADGFPASYADCIIFSMRSFATLSFSDIVSLNYFGRVWSCFEAMAGVMTFALIMYTFGRRLAGV